MGGGAKIKADLRAELGADPPTDLLAVLDAEEVAALANAVRDAKARQRAALDHAGEAALPNVPGIVRKAVFRVLR
jgi:hypothetical protein